MRDKRHWLRVSFAPTWTEVTREQWIQAEREAGFRPSGGGDGEATGGFGGILQGRLTYAGKDMNAGEPAHSSSIRSEALEEAAKVADVVWGERTGEWRAAAGKVAARIRALKEGK